MLCVSLKLVELLCSQVVERVFERESQRESASPFIIERGALQVREKERVCIRVLPSLVAHAFRYEMAASAHNAVYA